jgi:hypothetical protein
VGGAIPASVASRAVPLYRVYFRNQHSFIIGRDDFPAEDDQHAIVIAQTLAHACSDLCSRFELWRNERRVDAEVSGHFSSNSAEITTRVQKTVLERELVLRGSRWVIAESTRLLENIHERLEGPRDRSP